MSPFPLQNGALDVGQSLPGMSMSGPAVMPTSTSTAVALGIVGRSEGTVEMSLGRAEANVAKREAKAALLTERELPCPNWISSQTGKTARNARKLAENMKLPTKGLSPHHIVQSTDTRANAARALLDSLQIDINDAVNGVGLPWPQHQGQGLQTTDAINAVTETLRQAAGQGQTWGQSRQNVIAALQTSATQIRAGRFP